MICQLYATAISVAMFIGGARHHFWGDLTGWVLAGSWWGASLAMLAYRKPQLTRIGFYLACVPLLYYVGDAVVTVLAVPAHADSRALTDSTIVNGLSVVACLPLVFGLVIRIALQRDGRADGHTVSAGRDTRGLGRRRR